jgi:hypothetical protein
MVSDRMSRDSSCVYCLSTIEPVDSSTECEHCGARFHSECWDLNGGCATLGCESCLVAVKPAPLPVVPMLSVAATPPPRTTGDPVTSEWAPASVVSVPAKPARQFCDQCGGRVTDTDRFCGTCGNQLESM